MGLRAHASIIRRLFQRSKVLSLFILGFAAISISLNFMMTEHVMSFFTLILNTIIIGLLYGLNVNRSATVAEHIYNHTVDKKIELSGDTQFTLGIGLTAKNAFWVMAMALPLIGAINMWLPMVNQFMTYTIFDICFFGAIVYGLQASNLLNQFSAEVGIDMLNKHLGE